MAQIFRAFKMPGKRGAASRNDSGIFRQISPESEVSVSGVAPYIGSHYDDVSDSEGSKEITDTPKSFGAPERKVLRSSSTAKTPKDGIVSIRDRISARFRGQSISISSADGSRYAEAIMCSHSPDATNSSARYDLFRNELRKSHEIGDHVADCICQLQHERSFDDDRLHKMFTRFCDLLFAESWSAAENVFREEKEKLQKQVQYFEKKLIDALTSYMKDVTALRDQIRQPDGIIAEALAVSFFSPLDYVDESIRKLVQTFADERLKDIICEVRNRKCESFDALKKALQSKFCIGNSTGQDEHEQEHKDLVEVELKEHKNLVATLEQQHRATQNELNRSREEISVIRSEFQDRSHQSMQRIQALGEELEKLRSENENLVERLNCAELATPHSEAPVSLPETIVRVNDGPPCAQTIDVQAGLPIAPKPWDEEETDISLSNLCGSLPTIEKTLPKMESPDTRPMVANMESPADSGLKRTMRGMLDVVRSSIPEDPGALASSTETLEHYDTMQPAMAEWKKSKLVTARAKANVNRPAPPFKTASSSGSAAVQTPTKASVAAEPQLTMRPEPRPTKPRRELIVDTDTSAHALSPRSPRSPASAKTTSRSRRVSR